MLIYTTLSVVILIVFEGWALWYEGCCKYDRFEATRYAIRVQLEAFRLLKENEKWKNPQRQAVFSHQTMISNYLLFTLNVCNRMITNPAYILSFSKETNKSGVSNGLILIG